MAYYPEYHVTDRLVEDLDLMVAAGITVIRVGESVWSTWEPWSGHFELEWMQRVLDEAHERGIRVVLGTPTYAVPPWLQTAYPEIAGERRTGEKIAWGARQEVDYSHPAFRFHAERVIRAVIGRYASHPAIIGYQVDNEPGLELLHNHGVFTGFIRSLREQYGDVETLNREWGLTYWSHRIDDWSELWRPDGNTFPQYDLAWRRYQAQVTTDFIAWLADIVREYSTPAQFVTTCLQYPRRGVDDRTVFEALDIGSGNPYYGMQDHLDAGVDREHPNYWTTSGVAGLFRQADRLYSSKQQRYLVTETNAQAIDAAEANFPPYPGQLKQVAIAFVSRGAAMIEYWHWHTLPFGAETYWGGVLPHSLVPGRVYDEVAAIGAELKSLGGALEGFVPDADAAVLWSTPSRYAMQFMPPFPRDGRPDEESYECIVDSFYRGVIDSGRQARILHVEQARDLGAAELAKRFPVVIAAGLYISTDEDLELLREYAAHGGHLVLGPRSVYADEEARARIEVAPARLTGAAGVSYEEFSNLEAPLGVTGGSDFTVSAEARGTLWVDGLRPEGATELAGYTHPRFGRFPAVTTSRCGSGDITVVGTIPNPAFAADILSWVLGERVAAGVVATDGSVTVTSGTASGARFHFAFNWGWNERCVTLAAPATDAFSGEAFPAAAELRLGPWDVRVLRIDAEEAHQW
ncbi:beta-galactosidase (plasmid) [Rathayibacter sp. VKM Ac-2803]|uniref:beta-galactosidase n=2 Tax=Microbacteriaceae TaxID=85023 RepID=A0A2T4UNU7_9MICO|nr:beta-galactosidase [Rathayibacter sp. VKM Ac-2803]PTL71200.1 beta-galactosidase [Rathayibacter caricis DSM 15933]